MRYVVGEYDAYMSQWYYTKVFQWALSMTFSDLGFQSVKHSFVKALWIFILLFIMYMLGLDDLMKDKVGNVWTVILALPIIFAILFITNFILAPAAIQKESDEKISKLELQIENKEARQAAINKLWDLRSIGISLRNDGVETEEQLSAWISQYTEWRIETLSVAKEVSINLHNWLDRLDRMTNLVPNNVRHFSNEHLRLLNITSEILARLQKYLEREFLDVHR